MFWRENRRSHFVSSVEATVFIPPNVLSQVEVKVALTRRQDVVGSR